MNRHYTILLLVLISSGTCLAQLEKQKGAGGKIGFKDYDDNWIIQPQYDEATEFYDIAYAFAKLKGKWGMIDVKGQTIIPFEYSNIINMDDGDGQLYAVVKNKKYGLAELATGKVVVEPVYDRDFYFDDQFYSSFGALAVVYKNGKAGLIDRKGVEVVPCIYDDAKKNPFLNLDYDIYFMVRQNKKAGVINMDGCKLVVPCAYDLVKIAEGAFDIIRGGKYGLYSMQGKEIVAPLFDKPFNFDGEYASVQQKKKHGIIDKSGKFIVPCTFANDDEAYLELERLNENK